MYHILVVDDEARIRSIIRKYAEFEGHTVTGAGDGMEAVRLCRKEDFDIIILDIMMPELDGFSACREIRKSTQTPIIMLSARGEEYDRINGFECGADDYVVKPFDIKELSARVKAVLRRYQVQGSQTDDDVIRFDNIEISKLKYELKLKGRSIDIPPKELELLYFLASNYNRVFTRDQLLDKVWGFDYLGDSRTVDVHVKRLREKLEGVSEKWILKTVWGVGYKFEILS